MAGRLRTEAHDAAYTFLPSPLPWHEGPEVVNREIARRLELLEPPAFEEQSETGPAQRPAAIQPVWEDGVLTLPKTTAILTSKISNLLRRCGSRRRPRSGR
jgi:hypothetical protein